MAGHRQTASAAGPSTPLVSARSSPLRNANRPPSFVSAPSGLFGQATTSASAVFASSSPPSHCILTGGGHNSTLAALHRVASPSVGSRPSSSRSLANNSSASTARQRYHSSSAADHHADGSANVEQPLSSEWSYFGIDIPVIGVSALRDKLESSTPGGAAAVEEQDVTQAGVPGDTRVNASEDPAATEFLSCTFASGRWRVEINRDSPSTPHLSVYLCCAALDLDYPNHDSQISASIMLCVREPHGRRRIVWQTWGQQLFEHEREFWEHRAFPLPSVLLQNSVIASADSLVLSIQLQTPSGGPQPEEQNARQVPQALVSGLTTLLDDKKTGDVQFIVYERKDASNQVDSDNNTVPLGSPQQPMYRKRIIYAHTAILTARTAYFASMFRGEWQENDAHKRIVRVNDFEFDAIYWLLYWIYTNEIHFAAPTVSDSHGFDDFAESMLVSRAAPGYDWQRLRLGSDAGSSDSRLTIAARSDASDSAGQPSRASTSMGYVRPARIPRHVPPVTPSKGSPSAAADKRRIPSPEVVGRISPVQSLSNLLQLSSPKVQPSRNEDPHPHPVSVSNLPSAVQIYKIADRYGITELAELAKDHIVMTLRPESAFRLLLATQLYPVLYASVKAYAVQNYHAVSACPEFKRCFQEVGLGTWGEQGGEVLLDFLTSLTGL